MDTSPDSSGGSDSEPMTDHTHFTGTTNITVIMMMLRNYNFPLRFVSVISVSSAFSSQKFFTVNIWQPETLKVFAKITNFVICVVLRNFRETFALLRFSETSCRSLTSLQKL